MAIPESQLETWSHQGSVAQSAETYDIIQKVLNDTAAPYYSKDFSVFLQGSYGNATNVYRDSDVDVVIRLNQTVHYFGKLFPLYAEFPRVTALAEREHHAARAIAALGSRDRKDAVWLLFDIFDFLSLVAPEIGALANRLPEGDQFLFG